MEQFGLHVGGTGFAFLFFSHIAVDLYVEDSVSTVQNGYSQSHFCIMCMYPKWQDWDIEHPARGNPSSRNQGIHLPSLSWVWYSPWPCLPAHTHY